MKKSFFVLLVIVFNINISFCQYIQDSRIDSVVNLISSQRIIKNMRELTGDTIANVGGIPRLIFSRYYLSPGNELATQYIFEKFQSFGLNTYIQVTDLTCKNVIAVKQGTRFPNQKYIIGAHYDNILWPVNPGPLDTVYGADDNASGVCGVLEAAKLLANMNFEYTIVFAAWDQEEYGPVWGAYAYADSAYLRGDSIKAYINMDMLAWNYGNHNKLWAGPDSNSLFFTDIFNSLCNKYISSYIPVFYKAEMYSSDQYAFILKQYRVFNVAEYNVDLNPYYHKITDTYSNTNIPYCASLLKPTIAMLMVFALNKNAFYQHTPIVSSGDTTARIATSIIKFPNKLPVNSNKPRLYYKVNNEAYNYVNAYYYNLDTFKFSIPGKPKGTRVSYYLAAQDSVNGFVCTYPIGGSGVNPPGTTPPPTLFSYDVWCSGNYCSNNQRPILDLQTISDTIWIQQSGMVADVNVSLNINHTNDGDIFIWLDSPNSTTNLSQYNGNGGQNYTNTIFDDSATVPITQGIPPFTGSFKPQLTLTNFNNKQMSGPWILKIYDKKTGDQGTLLNWCLSIKYASSISVKENNQVIKEYKLYQNYPNPFNPSTIIKFQIKDLKLVTLKVYDILGKEVATLVNENLKAGEYEIAFSGNNLPSGIYFYKIITEDFSETKTMLLIK
jgi:subtilisin-like proprotein convertase family protein